MIIIIEALQGTGKTWLCNRISSLKHVVCVDLDKLALDAYEKSKSGRKKKEKLEDDRIQELVDKYAESKILVFVAVGLNMKILTDSTHYFMKIDNLEKTFRRFQMRELDKIVQNEKRIRSLIKNAPVERIKGDIDSAVEYVVGFWEFKDFKKRYEDMLKQAHHNHSSVKSQEGIFEDIKLANKNFSRD